MAKAEDKVSGSSDRTEKQANKSLKQQYESVLAASISYHFFSEPILKRARYRLWFLYLHHTFQLKFKKAGEIETDIIGRWFFRKMFGFGLPNPDIHKAVDAVVGEEERADLFYEVLASDYPVEGLCDLIEAKLPDVDFSQIEKIHGLRQRSLLELNLKKILLGGVLGLGAFFLHTVPASLVERVGVSLPDYEIVVFSIMTLFGFYCVVISSMVWFLGRRMRRCRRMTNQVISYLSIRSTKPSA